MYYNGGITLPLVKVKDKFQVTIPAEIREAMRLAVGDMLEATIQDKHIVLKPKAIVDREQAWDQVIQAMASVEDRKPKRKQSPKEQEEEIAHIVKDFRKRHATRRT